MLSSWRRASAAIALLAVVSGCTAGTSTRPQVAAPAPEAPPPVAEAPAPAPPKPVRPPEPANLMKVAVLVPMTGRNAAVGQAIANAATLALLDLNTQRLRLATYDTEAGAAIAAERAIAEGAAVILGPLFANEARVVQPIAQAANVPVISFSNDTGIAQPGTFVLGFQPSQEIARVVAVARQRGLQSFGALVPQGRYGETASSAFRSAVQSTGGRVSAIESYARDRSKLFAPARRVTNYEARLSAARAAATGSAAAAVPKLAPVPFQALMIGDSGDFAMGFAPVLRQFGAGNAQVRYLGTGLWAQLPDMTREAGLHGAWFAAVPDGQFEALVRRYQSQFGVRPARLASLGYDAMLLVAAVSERWTKGQPFPQAALLSSTGFSGIDGVFRFRRNGVAERGMAVFEVTPTGFRTVSPAPAALGPERVSALDVAPQLATSSPSRLSSTGQPLVLVAAND